MKKIQSLIIITVLSVVVFIVLDPVTRLADTISSKRWSDVNIILDAIYESTTDNDGVLPQGLTTSMNITQIGTANSGCDILCSVATASACVNLNGSLVKYLKTMPVDPSFDTQVETGYYVFMDGNNVVTVGACVLNNDEKIEVSR